MSEPPQLVSDATALAPPLSPRGWNPDLVHMSTAKFVGKRRAVDSGEGSAPKRAKDDAPGGTEPEELSTAKRSENAKKALVKECKANIVIADGKNDQKKTTPSTAEIFEGALRRIQSDKEAMREKDKQIQVLSRMYRDASRDFKNLQ
ncbi:hypothetical protein DENSPDRAFT_881064 [Dentipellis sp. KUC8613]|nr:hypothetical protein DENSPDRAFT_881064 [Dentipellis sp. KUC8613]